MSLMIPEIVDALAADFAARSVAAEVLFGDWEPAKHNVGNRVIVGVAVEFQDADLGPANAPGLQAIDEDKTMGARTLFTMVEIATVWVHAAPVGNENDPTRLKETFKATRRLLRATIAAMYRACPGAFGWGSGVFVKPEAAEFRFGALATFRAQFLTPVLDDEYPMRKPDGYSGKVYASMPNDGDVLVGTVQKDMP